MTTSPYNVVVCILCQRIIYAGELTTEIDGKLAHADVRSCIIALGQAISLLEIDT